MTETDVPLSELSREQLEELLCYRISRDFPNATHYGFDGIEVYHRLGHLTERELADWKELCGQLRSKGCVPSRAVEENMELLVRPSLDAFTEFWRDHRESLTPSH